MRPVLWLEAVRGPRSGRRVALLVLAVAAVLYGAVFALREVVASPEAAVLVLLCLPVLLLAASFGRWAGVGASALATGLVGVWNLDGGDVGGAFGYVTRGAVYLLIGFLTGWYTEALDDAQRANRRFVARAARARAELEEAQRLAEMGSWTWDATTDELHWSREMYRIYAMDPGGDRLTFAAAVALRSHPDDAAVPLEARDRALVDQEPFIFDQRLLLPDGSTRFVLNRGEVMLDRYGTVTGIRGTTQDVTSRYRDARAVERAAALFTAAFDNAPVGMALLSAEGVITRANAELGAITGRPADSLVGTRAETFLHPMDVEAGRLAFARVLAGEARGRSDMRVRAADGTSRWVSTRASLVDDADGVHVLAHVEDIDDRKTMERRLRYLADHDPLTGLFNRRRFVEELNHQVAVDSRYGGTSAAVLLDLDHFKIINDTLGHPMGDRLLRRISRTIRSRLRDSDVVGRLGGDEFAILLPNSDDQHAGMLTASVLDGIRATVIEHAGRSVGTTATAGIARTDTVDVTDASDVVANADLAMYAAKEEGRDTFVVYDPEGPHAARSRARYRWLDRIRQALEDELFVLHAQPILDLATGTITGCELLLRMEEETGLVSPSVFLYIAERHGLSVAIDRYVITHALDLVGRARRPPGFRWEINLSADSLSDPGIPDLIESGLATAGVDPDSIVFEITETVAIANMDEAEAFARRLTDMGCRFALDDFGAGYGSFYYLKHLPFQYLKIDGEFIRQLATSDTDRIIVDAIVSAARRLGKQTIAEYVGDATTLAVLRDLHVDHAQGYHIGRPVDPDLLDRLPDGQDGGDASDSGTERSS